MEQEGTQEPARFDPRIAEPPAVPTLIPVLRPAGAEDAAAVGDLAIDPEDPGLLDLDPAESAHPAAVAVEPLPPNHPLTKLPNVTLSAHSAFRTPEASDNLIEAALEHCRRIQRENRK